MKAKNILKFDRKIYLDAITGRQAMRKVILILLSITFLTGCNGSKYREGECVQNIYDGFTWRITKTGAGECTFQGWHSGKWGIPVKQSCGLLNGVNYVRIKCPFSEKVLPR